MHYQFEAIHPFPDGNGRTGRILNLLFLVEKQLIDIPVLFLSRYIITHRQDYYDGLRAITEAQDWEAWVLFMLKAVESTAQQTFDLVNRILALMDDVRDRVQREAEGIYSKDLIETIFMQPYTKISFLVDAELPNGKPPRYLQTLASRAFARRTGWPGKVLHQRWASCRVDTLTSCLSNRHILITCRFISNF